MNVYVICRTDRIDGMIATMFALSNEPELAKTSQLLNKASKDIAEWAVNMHGHVILEGVWLIAFCIPADKLIELAGVRDRYQSFVNHTISMGIGMSICEAQGALEHSVHNGGDRITFWTDDLDADQGEEHGDLLAGLDGDSDISKAEPMPSESSESSKEQEPVAPQADAQGQPKDPREQITAALKEIKDAAPAIEALKAKNPQAYAAIKDTIDAMIMMAQGVMQKSEKKAKKEELSASQTPDEESSVLDKDELDAKQKHSLPAGLPTAGDVSGTIKDGKINTSQIDPLTGTPTGKTQWHSGRSGLVTGSKSGVSVSARRQGE